MVCANQCHRALTSCLVCLQTNKCPPQSCSVTDIEQSSNNSSLKNSQTCPVHSIEMNIKYVCNLNRFGLVEICWPSTESFIPSQSIVYQRLLKTNISSRTTQTRLLSTISIFLQLQLAQLMLDFVESIPIVLDGCGLRYSRRRYSSL